MLRTTFSRTVAALILIPLSGPLASGQVIPGDQVLQAFAKTQEMRSRIIYDYQTTEDAEGKMTGIAQPFIGAAHREHKGQYRTDGKREFFDAASWGTRLGGSPTDTLRYINLLADGKAISYQGVSNRPGGFATLETGVSRYPGHAADAPGTMLDGYIGVAGQRERIDDVLKSCADAKFTEMRNPDGSVQCIVAQGSTAKETFKVYFDPAHGYNISKAESLWTAPSGYKGRTVSEHTVVETGGFDKIGDVWVPAQATIKAENKKTKGEYTNSITHVVRTNIQVNPDFEALGSFSMKAFPEGTTVLLAPSYQKYLWKNGQLVLQVDDKAIRTIDKELSSLDASLSKAATQPGESGADNGMLANYRATRLAWFPLYVKDQGDVVGSVSRRNQPGPETAELRYDGKQDILFRRQLSPQPGGYSGFSWDGKQWATEGLDADTTSSLPQDPNADQVSALVARQYRGAALLGILADDTLPVDGVLQGAKMTVQQGVQKVGDYQCSVLEAKTATGTYRLWVAPKNGYNIVKAQVLKQGGPGKPALEFSLDKVKLAEIDGVWIPTSATILRGERQNNVSKSTETRETRTEIHVKVKDIGPQAYRFTLSGDSSK